MLSTAPAAPNGGTRFREPEAPEAEVDAPAFQPTRSGGLDYFWDRPVRELVTTRPDPLTDRHRAVVRDENDISR